MVNTEIRLIMFFAAKDGEALYIIKSPDAKLLGFKSGVHRFLEMWRSEAFDLPALHVPYTVKWT